MKEELQDLSSSSALTKKTKYGIYDTSNKIIVDVFVGVIIVGVKCCIISLLYCTMHYTKYSSVLL